MRENLSGGVRIVFCYSGTIESHAVFLHGSHTVGIPRAPSQAKLFVAVMYSAEDVSEGAVRALTDRFGETDYRFGPIHFDFTDYYEKEMGSGLLKTYLTFKRPVATESLAELKHLTNALEAESAREGRRRCNLDPGYLTRDKLVLASTKDFYHRIHLGKGIFAEVTLHYRQGVFRHFSWTYPDYREREIQQFLSRARKDIHADKPVGT